MKGYDYLSNEEVLNPFLTFCRYFDDLGAVSNIQVVGQHIVAILNSLLIIIQMFSSVVLIIGDTKEGSYYEVLRNFRIAFGLYPGKIIRSIYSIDCIYTLIVILIMSIISIIIRLNQMKSKTIQPMPILVFNTFFNIISPLAISCTSIGFVSAICSFIELVDYNSLIIALIAVVAYPPIIFALFRLITDSRMEKLPYVSPNFEISASMFLFYLLSISCCIYAEYSPLFKGGSTFVISFLILFGIILLFSIFRTPAYSNGWHSFLIMNLLFWIILCECVIIYSLHWTILPSTALYVLLIAQAVFAVLSLGHVVVSRYLVRRLLDSIYIVDPKNYSLQRLVRILCVADVRNDQIKFPVNFPELLMRHYPSHSSIVVFAMMYKLYDTAAHKELLRFAEKYAMYNSRNIYISSVLRTIIFIASGSTTINGNNISRSLLSMCYRCQEQYWYYLIQNNRSMCQRVFHELAQIIQSAKPFFKRHNAVIGGEAEFSRELIYVPQDGSEQDSFQRYDLEEEDMSDEYNDPEMYDINADYYKARIESISKVNPRNYLLMRYLLIFIMILLIASCFISYILISNTNYKPYTYAESVKLLISGYASIITAFHVPGRLYQKESNETERNYGIKLINQSFDDIYSLSYLKKNQTLYNLLLTIQGQLLEAVDEKTFVSDPDDIQSLYNFMIGKGKSLFGRFTYLWDSISVTMLNTLYGLVAVFVVFVIIFTIIRILSVKFFEYLGAQPMHFSKTFSSYMSKKYSRLMNHEMPVVRETKMFRSTFNSLVATCFFPLAVGVLYSIAITYVNYDLINLVRTVLYVTQAVPLIANNDIYLPIMYNSTTPAEVCDGHAIENLRVTYSLIEGIYNVLYTNNVTYKYVNSSNLTEFDNMIDISQLKASVMRQSLGLLNNSVYVDFFNSSSIMLRNIFIILKEFQTNEDLHYYIKMSIPSSLSCTQPIISLIVDMQKEIVYKTDAVLFLFIFAPIVYTLAIFMMIVYAALVIKRVDMSVFIIKRIISLPKHDNPFFTDNNQFLGFKEILASCSDHIFHSFPIPTFQATKDLKIIAQNEAAVQLFGDIKGTSTYNLPYDVTDSSGCRHYFSYTKYPKRALPESVNIEGDIAIISNDLTGLHNKKETLKNLYKDIRLTFSIPTVLQRDKPTHIQGVAIVNFGFSPNITKEMFLTYSSKVEDFFSQFVSFFMFEKLRFSFYVLFYDPNASRQAARDAVLFAQMARYEAQNRKMEVKIACAVEDDVIAKAEKTDMIWSVKFPNSILWRTDLLLAHIDYGRIICQSKMSPGMHFTQSISIGKYGEVIEVITS